MSTLIKLRRSAVPGRVPTTAQLELGEIAINTADGKIYIKQYDVGSNTESIVAFSADPSDLLDLLKGVDGANSGLDADLLDGQEGAYYLDFTNFTNLPDPQIDVDLSGKVTGSGTTTLTNLGNGSISIITELANTAVIAGTYGSASQIPVFVVDEDGRLTSANTVAVRGVESTTWYVANNTFSIETGEGSVFNTVIDSFNDISANNITVDGLVDGRDIAADGSKLDGIETGATADQSNTEIFNAVLTLDGSNSGLDADLLDGQQGSYYLDYDNFFNTPSASSFDLTLTLDGKVTGTAFSNTGVMTLSTELANTGVTAGTYGASSQIPVFTVDEDGRLTSASNVAVAGVDSTTWTVANNTFTIETVDGGAYNTIIDEFSDITINGDVGKITFDSLIAPEITNQDGTIRLIMFGDGYTPGVSQLYLYANTNVWVDTDLTVTGNITTTQDISANNIIVSGLIDGRDIAADGAKLDLLEDGLDLTLTGKVTGFASSNTGVMTLTTELANTGVTAGTYGGATEIPIITIDEDGRITLANTAAVAGISSTTWYVANNTFSIITGDGASFNTIIDDFTDLDADTLSGQTVAEILAAAANNASNTVTTSVGSGTVTLTANNGVIGFGEFGLNDFGNTSITIEHADTSSVSDVDNSDGNVIQDLTFDTFGHVQTVGSVDLDGRYYTETEVDSLLDGKVDNTVNVIAGNGLSGGGPLTANVTISHADTSSVANTGTLDLANNQVIESVSFDEFGHVVAITTGNLSVLTQEDADLRYVNVDGDTMTGDLTVQADIIQDHAAYVTNSTTTTSTTPTNILSFSSTTYNSAEVIITASQGINRHITKLLVVHNGTTASATEFGTIYTNTSLATYDVGISAGNVNVTVTSASGTATVYKIAATLIID